MMVPLDDQGEVLRTLELTIRMQIRKPSAACRHSGSLLIAVRHLLTRYQKKMPMPKILKGHLNKLPFLSARLDFSPAKRGEGW